MATGSFRFAGFTLDPGDRQLRRDGAPVELNSRYFDALALLVREQGKLVSKDRFMEEVWRGVPVTDEALTQCIRTLRRRLGDDAARPRFIETAPKHGYRFIAPVEWVAHEPRPTAGAKPGGQRRILLLAGAGTLSGGAAGAVGGLFYGLVASQPLEAGLGAVSVLLVLVSLTILVGLAGSAAVALGIAAAGLARRRPPGWSILGGAAGGLLVGGIVKLLGLDAFNLLFGRSPGDITGAPEGALLGAAVGLGAWLGARAGNGGSISRAVAVAGFAGAAAGGLIPFAGGRLMGGSLALLAERFPGSRLRLDQLGPLFGEDGFGLLSQAFTGALEGLLFCACVAGAITWARRRLA